ncbi:hypothetical protein B0J13DRAFT_670867 [Dactylonectria estremocensis]|uniref:Uncharacterized protein n=1 Tax=Dactylonectria estremocensis TaxID=1079267 RepID=A0A9P9JG84_9HYPO|nr:hypothetical protein B0J13DRAFT_670867 [Dactylonectria estremocensis]
MVAPVTPSISLLRDNFAGPSFLIGKPHQRPLPLNEDSYLEIGRKERRITSNLYKRKCAGPAVGANAHVALKRFGYRDPFATSILFGRSRPRLFQSSWEANPRRYNQFGQPIIRPLNGQTPLPYYPPEELWDPPKQSTYPSQEAMMNPRRECTNPSQMGINSIQQGVFPPQGPMINPVRGVPDLPQMNITPTQQETSSAQKRPMNPFNGDIRSLQMNVNPIQEGTSSSREQALNLFNGSADVSQMNVNPTQEGTSVPEDGLEEGLPDDWAANKIKEMDALFQQAEIASQKRALDKLNESTGTSEQTINPFQQTVNLFQQIANPFQQTIDPAQIENSASIPVPQWSANPPQQSIVPPQTENNAGAPVFQWGATPQQNNNSPQVRQDLSDGNKSHKLKRESNSEFQSRLEGLLGGKKEKTEEKNYRRGRY